jgi:hypothetical protein
MSVRIINGVAELRSLVGQEIGSSDWFTMKQSLIDAFADATKDRQWIHIDAEPARAESPFGNLFGSPAAKARTRGKNSKLVIAVDRSKPLPVGRAADDKSSYGCRDMAGSGTEWTDRVASSDQRVP